MQKTIFERNFSKMQKLGFLKILEVNDGYAKIKNSGFMDLVIEKYDDDKIVLAHYYEQNGDLVPDPDLLIKVFPEMKMVEVLTYQDSYSYQPVYSDDGKFVYPQRKRELNKFLGFFLTNLKNQGFVFSENSIVK